MRMPFLYPKGDSRVLVVCTECRKPAAYYPKKWFQRSFTVEFGLCFRCSYQKIEVEKDTSARHSC